MEKFDFSKWLKSEKNVIDMSILTAYSKINKEHIINISFNTEILE